jgi:hypothetical protein
MQAFKAMLWVSSVCVGLQKSQAKTLAAVVSAALSIGRVSLSELGRLLAEDTKGASKHAIKRVRRFTSNDRVHISDAMQGPLKWLLRSRAWRQMPLVVALALADWLLVGVGLLALAKYSPRMGFSSNRRASCGVFFIGRKMIARLPVTAEQALTALIAAFTTEAAKGDKSALGPLDFGILYIYN